MGLASKFKSNQATAVPGVAPVQPACYTPSLPSGPAYPNVQDSTRGQPPPYSTAPNPARPQSPHTPYYSTPRPYPDLGFQGHADTFPKSQTGNSHSTYSPYGPPQSGQANPGQASHYNPFAASTPPMRNPANRQAIETRLRNIISVNKLEPFYPPHVFTPLVDKVAQVDFESIARDWKLSLELAYDLAALALYDVAFFCDDSGSMVFEERGERIEDLKVVLARVAAIVTMFDDDGIVVRFMNSDVSGDGIRTAAESETLVDSVPFGGGTPLGTQLEAKILSPFVLKPANSGSMPKPVMIVTITDGEPVGEPRDKLVQVMRNAKHSLDRTRYGRNAMAMQIAQVGKDSRAQSFLAEIDNNRSVGKLIDCTSYYELEEKEWRAKGVELTPELWLLKICLGAIDPTYDDKD